MDDALRDHVVKYFIPVGAAEHGGRFQAADGIRFVCSFDATRFLHMIGALISVLAAKAVPVTMSGSKL
jgi:hypothetical protein